jgi:hypothetical protein
VARPEEPVFSTVEMRFDDVIYILLNPLTVETRDGVDIYERELAKPVVTWLNRAKFDWLTFDTVENSWVDDT